MYLQSDGHESGKYCERARLSSIERATTMTRKKDQIPIRLYAPKEQQAKASEIYYSNST